MKKPHPLLDLLARNDVTELALASGQPPRVRIGDALHAAEDAPLTADRVFEVLMLAGGSRYVEELSDKPSQWRTRIEGIGVVAVVAMQRGPNVAARLVPSSREPATASAAFAPSPSPVLGRTLYEPAAPPIAFELAEPGAPIGAGAPVATPGRVTSNAHAPAVATEPARTSLSTPRGPAEALAALLESARRARASDLHLVAARPPLLRVAGTLTPSGAPLDPDDLAAMLASCVPPERAAVLEADGSCDFALDSARAGRFRVNVSRQRTGMMGSFRLVAAEIPSLASLGLPEEIALATKHHQGLIVVTGPTGHGKTSTLAAIVDRINANTTLHVITVEDPVEYVHPRKKAMMSQREVGTHTRSFQAALKASLREDPDVIVVGELRDTETVRMALSASETGHLVLGTMNTPGAAKTIDRLIDLFPPADQAQVRATLAGGLRLIVSQRLVPAADGSRMFAAVELLPGALPLWNLIRDNKTFQIPSLQQRGKGLGILRLDDALADLVRQGKVSAAAALAVADAPDELEALVQAGRAAPAPAPAPRAPDDANRNLFQKAGALFGKKGG
jgi:twitching motility protein PilT